MKIIEIETIWFEALPETEWRKIKPSSRPCNAKKSDRIASVEHLEAWVKWNTEQGKTMAAQFDHEQIIHNLPTSFKVAKWAYSQIESSGGLMWWRGGELICLDPV